MHGSVVPTKEQLAASERTIGSLPVRHDVTENDGQVFIQLWEPPLQENAQVDTFSVVVQLSPVHGQTGPAGEWLRQPLFVE